MRIMLIMITLCLVLSIGCSKKNTENTQSQTKENIQVANDNVQKAENTKIIEIKEKMFIAQTNDIYLNADEYLGRTIKYEGIFDFYDMPDGEKLCYVIRYGPGCCPADSNAGFEVVWDKGYPNNKEWVEVTGVLEEYYNNGYEYLRLALKSLKVLNVRGAETVSR